MVCISWVSDENVWMQSEVGELVSWSSMKEKLLKFGEKILWVEKTSESGCELLVLLLRTNLSLEKLGWNGKTWKIEAKSSFLSKTQVSSHSKASLALSKDKWCRWGS